MSAVLLFSPCIVVSTVWSFVVFTGVPVAQIKRRVIFYAVHPHEQTPIKK